MKNMKVPTKTTSMPILWILFCLCCHVTHSKWTDSAKKAFDEADNKMSYVMNHLTTVSRQVMLQQFFSEQRVRSEGQSGVKIIRLRNGGTKNYFANSHSGKSSLAVHDHSNNIRTVGMGEFIGVLNGIEFQTRHNDYRLFMPHRTSKEYGAVEPVPFPSVPSDVSKKGSVDEQIVEMREWFKAWRDQNHTVRDYRKYFKPVLCYLEGGWTNGGSKVDEPFSSDRHFIDAKSWMELHEKVRFTAYTGSKSINENLSFLPTKIMRLINGTIPHFAQWNYRIMCHPVKQDIPLNRLRVVEDLSSRMMTGDNIHRYLHSRSARFQFNSKDEDKFYDRPLDRGFLDEIMEEIPGKDNYQGNLTDEGLDTPALNFDKTVKDVSRYHRWLSTAGRDAMGTTKQHRGYNDDFLFASMTTQSKISRMEIEQCKWRRGKKTCHTKSQRWTYAIPLELIYLTPLHRWNPYNLKYHGEHRVHAKTARAGGRNGGCSDKSGKKAFNGTTSKLYYVTPNEFYSGSYVGATAADTVRYSTCILDNTGESRQVRAAGVHVFLPSIKDVGILRTRYPVYPVHSEGSSVWKELNALREIMMDAQKWKHMHWSAKDLDTSGTVIMATGPSRVPSKTTAHTHEVELTLNEISQIRGGRTVVKTSSTANGHQHELQIKYNRNNGKYYYHRCDGKWMCWDRHVRDLLIKETNAGDAL